MLKRSWKVVMTNFKPAMATMVVAHNLEVQLDQLQTHLEGGGTSWKEILDLLPTLQKAAGYMADVSVKSVKLSAKAAASHKAHSQRLKGFSVVPYGMTFYSFPPVCSHCKGREWQCLS